MCMCACSGFWRYYYYRGCKKTTRPERKCGCEENAGGDVVCECYGDMCNGIGGWLTNALPSCSQPDTAQLKGEEEEDSSVGAVMIVDVVVLITGVVASQLLI